jgi:hypothetical protein
LAVRCSPSTAFRTPTHFQQASALAPRGKATPDLTKVDEISFSDLMPGGMIPSASRVSYFEVYGKPVRRSR